MEKFAHPMLTHRNGDKCIWLEGTGWFVPLDAGGEGNLCENEEHLEFLAPQGKWMKLIYEGMSPVKRYPPPRRKSPITKQTPICEACQQRKHDECTGRAYHETTGANVVCFCATAKHTTMFKRR